MSFLFFHGMVGIGFAMIAIAALGFLYFRNGTLHERRWLLWILVFSVLGPQIANQLGWFAAEVGRQPWIVYHLMRTPAGLSAVVKANVVLTSLILFTFIYFLLFAVFIYLLNDKIQHGPDDADLTPSGKLALPTKKQMNANRHESVWSSAFRRLGCVVWSADRLKAVLPNLIPFFP